MAFHLSKSLFYYTQKQKVISSHGLNDWLRRRWSKNHSLGGGCFVSMSITTWHLREVTPTSVGHKYDTVPWFLGWLALDQEGKSSQPADDSIAFSSHPDLLRILPIFFFSIKGFPGAISISVSLFWSTYVNMWLLSWYKLLHLVSCSGSKYFEQEKPPIPARPPPPISIGWVNN